jgi:Rod binding domain-containing protein
MFDKEVSVQMAKRGAMGVADFMAKAVKQQTQPSTVDMLKARTAMPLHPQELSKPLGAPAQDSKALPKLRIKTFDELKLMNRSGS